MELFNNPMVENAKQSLSQEQKDRYAMLGESMYKDLDFEKCNSEGVIQPVFMNDALVRLDRLIQSGLDIKELNEDEVKFLKEMRGDKWYEFYNL